jgi:putative transposase
MKLTIRCGIVQLTKRKKELLDAEYNNLQLLLKGNNDVKLYSANRQQALRYYKTKKMRNYPLSIRNDLTNIQKTKSFYFVKIPVYDPAKKRGNAIKVPFKPHRELPKEYELCESKLIKRNGQYILNLTIEIQTIMRNSFDNVLAVDVGEHIPATTVLLQSDNVMSPMFLGKEVRGIRRHYAYLRKRLQERGLEKVVKRIADREQRKINDILHKVSRNIVDSANANNSIIVLGDLKGIRDSAQKKGRRMRRIVNAMPFYKLRNMIEYKAQLLGIPVISGSEYMTSRTCHKCGLEGKRTTQGRFVCKVCGEYNADLNGAINIGKRILSYMDTIGAVCGFALNSDAVLSRTNAEKPIGFSHG